MNRRLMFQMLALALLAGACSDMSDERLTPSATGDELFPNVEALEADDFSLETSDGATYLRFDTTTWNSGSGPLELVAGEVIDENTQKVYQRIYLDGGGHKDHLAGDFVWHDDHDHFHFEGYAIYSLLPADSNVSTRTGNKTTFCIMDTDRLDHRLPGAPKRAVYTECDDGIQGMSVGWGDTYESHLAGQEIDVTDLPPGEYKLTIEADPKDRILETSDDDNTSEVLLYLDVDTGTVEIIDDSDDSDDGPGGGNGNGNCPHC